eukprot:gene36372-biopygen3618
MKPVVRASVDALTMDEAAAVCEYTLEGGPYTILNQLLREENLQLLDPFVDYLWLLMHGLNPASKKGSKGERMIHYDELSIGEELGQGAFGVVYQGTWRLTDVAIKKLLLEHLTDDARKEFEAEAQTMKKLRHPNIVQFLGYCISPRPCIVMEYMRRGSLHQLLGNRQAEIPWDVRMWIALDMTRGLAYLHADKIVHRDIKSMNVLLTEGKACLADFGLARVKTETRAVSTKSSQAAGTLRWMAPELFFPRAVYTQKSDVYSLGWVLWELASRRIPFQEAPSIELISKWVKEGVREGIPEDCPAGLANVIKDCWDGDPAKRPEANAVVVLLVSGGPPPPPPTKPLEQLNVDELERWLASINLSHLASKLKEHNVTAEGLSLCESMEELVECGMNAINARLLKRRIEEVRGVGVPLTAIAPPQIPPRAPTTHPTPAHPATPTPPPAPAPPGWVDSPSLGLC